MTAIEVAQKVYNEKQAVLCRPTKNKPGEYDVKDLFQGSKSGWLLLDGFSASAVVKVYEALSEENKKKFANLTIQKMATVAFKLMK